MKIAFDLTPRDADFDKTSFIFPLTPLAETWEEDGLSTELETMESMKKFSSSSLLLEAPQKVRKSEHLKGKGDHIDASSGHLRRKADDSANSGYLDFSDTRKECESGMIQNHHRTSTLSAEELVLSDPSLRGNAQSPELHILNDSSPPPSVSPEKKFHIVQASNPAFEFSPGDFPSADKDGGRYSNADMDHRSPSPEKDNHQLQVKASGFSVKDSGCPLSEDSNFEKRSSNANLAHGSRSIISPKRHFTAEDSGFPLDDSSSLLLNRVPEVVTAKTAGYPIEQPGQGIGNSQKLQQT